MEIRIARNTDRDTWNSYVTGHPDASPYHLFAWKEAVEGAYGHRSYYLIAGENGSTKGVFPLFHMHLPVLQNELVSLPFCDLGGILADSPTTTQALLDESLALGRDLKTKSIHIRIRNHSEIYERLSYPCHCTKDKVSMLLTLPGTSEILWNGFKSKLRSQIRKAEKNGLRFEWGNAKIDEFYSVFSRNMRDLGSPVHAKKWIQAILHHYDQQAQAGLIFKDKTPIGAGIILLLPGQKVSIPWASTLREYNRLGPNMLLYWNFLKFAADNNFLQFDFGRSTPGEGTYKYKAQWGAKPAGLHWYQVFLRHKIQGTNPSMAGKREVIEQIWQKMPLGMANLLGPRLRRYISL